MMKISTKGRYAIRLMLDLAGNNTGQMVAIRDIARRQNISEKYLEQIIAILKRAGYVRSLRGAQGGYCLSKKPEEYTIGMLLRLTEGPLAVVACLEEEAVCERSQNCVSAKLWTMVNDAVNGVVDHVTLADMIRWEKEMEDATDERQC